MLLFDNAFIPWENVLVYRDIERANSFYRASGFFSRYNLQSGTRLGVKLDFMAGLFAKGDRGQRHGRVPRRAGGARRDDRLAQPDLGAHDGDVRSTRSRGPGDSVIPKMENAATLCACSRTSAGRRSTTSSRPILGGSPLVAPSSYKDLLNPELRPLIDQYYRGSDSYGRGARQALQADLGRDRHRVRRAARAVRAQLLRQQRADPPRRAEFRARQQARWRPATALADQCMADYDLNGWTGDTWT